MSKKNKVVSYPGQPRKKFKRKALTVIISLCIVVAFVLYMGQVIAYWQAKSELRALEQKQETLEAESEALREEMVLLQDEEYIEIKAREKLGLIRPGEKIFKVID